MNMRGATTGLLLLISIFSAGQRPVLSDAVLHPSVAERAMVVVVRDYLTTGKPDAGLLPMLDDVFNLQVLSEDETIDSKDLYDSMMNLRPHAVLYLVFGAPAHPVGARANLQQALERLRIPLISVCLEVPPALLASTSDGCMCEPVALQPDLILVHGRFDSLVRVWHRTPSRDSFLSWQYETAPHDSSRSDASIYQAVIVCIHSSVVKSANDTRKPPIRALPEGSQGHLDLYLSARESAKASGLSELGRCAWNDKLNGRAPRHGVQAEGEARDQGASSATGLSNVKYGFVRDWDGSCMWRHDPASAPTAVDLGALQGHGSGLCL